MVKGSKKVSKTQTNTINSILSENKTSPKSKHRIDNEYYQKNKEHKKQQRRQRYTNQKKQEELTTKQQSGKYYGAEAFKILMSLKEYTELNQQKRKLWLNFN